MRTDPSGCEVSCNATGERSERVSFADGREERSGANGGAKRRSERVEVGGNRLRVYPKFCVAKLRGDRVGKTE